MNEISVVCNNHPTDPFAEIMIEGFETATGMDDAIVYLAISEVSDDFALYVWADINQENPTHIIPLGHARRTHKRDNKELP